MERSLAEGVRGGRVSDEKKNATIPEKPEAAAPQFTIECHKAADEAFAVVTEQQLAAHVESPFGTSPGWQFFTFAYGEHWHHRGQRYTYIWLISKEPPILWPAYQAT